MNGVQGGSTEQMICYFDKLPKVLYLPIFNYLKEDNPKQFVKNISLVCKLWNTLVYKPALWKREIPVVELIQYNVDNFKSLFLNKLQNITSTMKKGEFFQYLENIFFYQPIENAPSYAIHAKYCVKDVNQCLRIKELVGNDCNFLSLVGNIYLAYLTAIKLNLQKTIPDGIEKKVSNLLQAFNQIMRLPQDTVRSITIECAPVTSQTWRSNYLCEDIEKALNIFGNTRPLFASSYSYGDFNQKITELTERFESFMSLKNYTHSIEGV